LAASRCWQIPTTSISCDVPEDCPRTCPSARGCPRTCPRTARGQARGHARGQAFHAREARGQAFHARGCPRTGVSCQLAGARGQAFHANWLVQPAVGGRRAQYYDPREWSACPRTGVSCCARVPEDRRFMLCPRTGVSRSAQTIQAPLICLSRSPLAGRPRLLGAAAHSGLYRDRTAGGAGDEGMRSRQGGELARRPFHRMRYPTIGG
jgi:hypothetical protein